MDEQKNNNDINLLAKEYADQAVREARKSRGENGRNALTKLMILFSLAVLAFAVFIFATIAWFTMSRATMRRRGSILKWQRRLRGRGREEVCVESL